MCLGLDRDNNIFELSPAGSRPLWFPGTSEIASDTTIAGVQY